MTAGMTNSSISLNFIFIFCNQTCLNTLIANTTIRFNRLSRGQGQIRLGFPQLAPHFMLGVDWGADWGVDWGGDWGGVGGG